MQSTNIMHIEELNSNNVDLIQSHYEDFRLKSASDYKFEIAPLAFDDFKNVIKAGFIKGFILFENSKATGFMLYVHEEHKAIELNLIYIAEPENVNDKRMELIKALQEKIQDDHNWNVISYPMLGIQETFVKDIATLGFKLVGQAIVKFKFNNPISRKILSTLTLSELLSEYQIVSWKNEYFEQASQVVHDTFKTSSDALFDPRFLTLEGSKDVVEKVVTNIFGLFLPECTSVLLYNNEPVGICFANITDALAANVPLIAVKKEHKNKGFGKYLLKNTVEQVLNRVITNKIFATEVNAAVETDNYPALRMYRKIGFREEYTYPHAYLNNPNFKE